MGDTNKPMPLPGGGKPSLPGSGSYDWSLGLPVTKETATTYGGGKPGKAPTPKPPKTPDPFEIIKAQGIENRVNEIGPSGSTIYSRDPSTGVWTANREFSPELQDLYNKQIAMIGGDPNAYNQEVADAMFSRQKAMLDPIFSQQTRTTEQKLADQGLPMEGEAYKGEFDRLQRMQNEAMNNAALQSILSGTQTGMQQRQNEFNQLAALLGGQQVGPTSPIDVMGPFNAQQTGQWNAYQAAANNAAQTNAQRTSGAASLASLLAMMMFSSKKLKDNNRKISEEDILDKLERLPVEQWTYKGDSMDHLGPYAEDFQRIFHVGDGLRIYPVDALGVCLAAIKALSRKIEHLEQQLGVGHA